MLRGTIAGAAPNPIITLSRPGVRKGARGVDRRTSTVRKRLEEPRCSNGIHCVAYPTLGEPSRLSRSNPGPRCFACEERRVSSQLKASVTAKEEEVLERGRANGAPSSKSNRLEDGGQGGYAHEVLERRRRSVLTCERGLRTALASGDERLAQTWARALKDAEERLVWAEADLQAARTNSEGVPS